MTRVSDASSINALISQMQKTEARRVEANFNVVTGKISRDYAGIATQSRRLVNLETSRDLAERFISNNQTAELRLDVMALTLESIDTIIRDFRSSVNDFRARDSYARQDVEELQTFAFNSLKSLEAYLNVETDGQYIFSGTKVNTEPVNLGLTSKDAFQAKYDGSVNSYATTRDAHLSTLSLSSDTTKENAEFVNASNWLKFRRDDDGDATTSGTSSIEATSALFSGYKVGSRITISGTGSNDGDYTVQSVSSDGTKIFVETEMLTDETLPGGLTDATAQGAVTFTLPNGTQLNNAGTGNIDFDRVAGTITAVTADAFQSVNVGDTIQLGGVGAANGTVTVTAIDANNQVLTVSSGPVLTKADGTRITVDDFEKTVFDRAAGTITSSLAGGLSGLSAGDQFTVSNSADNNGTYTVGSVSSDGTQLTILQSKLTDEGTTSGTTYFDYTVGSRLSFNTTTDTIQAQTITGTALAGAFSNLRVGDSITVANSPTNDGSFTISAISSDGSTLTLDAATQLPGSTEVDNNGTALTVPARGFTYDAGNEILFDAATETISLRDITTAGNATLDIFDNLRVGMQFTVAGTTGGLNDGVFTVASIAADGASLTVSENITTTQTFDPSVTGTAVTMKVFSADGTIATSQSYYQGDTLALTHRVDESRTIDVDISAAHPTFEKMIRAMSLIAQGSFGSEGGLESNRERINQAIFLADDAIAAPSEGTPPFGAELKSDLNEIIFDLGFKQVVLRDSIENQKDFNNLLNGFISRTENVDETEAITNLLDSQRALEASYQALSRVFSMSLADFL